MRIVLPQPVKPGFSEHLSEALDIAHIRQVTLYSPTTGLPSDELTTGEIIKQIDGRRIETDMPAGFIISNYPGNVIQAQSLDMALAGMGQPLNAAVMMEIDKSVQNRESKENRALIRYYRTQNKLILFNDSDQAEEICSKIQCIYAKRRSSQGNSSP